MPAKKDKSKSGLSIQPLGDRILVKPQEEAAEKIGNLYIPDTAKEKPQEGEVVAVGTGKKTKDGNEIPFDVKVGDRVMYGKYSGTEIKVEGEAYLMMHESDVLAVVE